MNLNNHIFSAILLAVVLLISTGECQRKNKWRKQKNSKKDCNLKSIEKCFNTIDEKKKDPNRHLVLKTADGLDEICRDSQDVISCMKKHIEQCGTPLHYEFLDFLTEYLVRSLDLTCKPGSIRNDFLANSVCIATKVLDTTDYKTECSRPYQALVSALKPEEDTENRWGSACCAFSKYKDCADKKTEQVCGVKAKEAFQKFRDDGIGNLLSVMCPVHSYDFKTESCKKRMAKYKGKTEINEEHPLIKYMLAYMRFILPK
ncbi:uncharacterized protein LOC141857941 [Brevipalpus obovatus]|uniref:uncharacterized protein LOC141857941 n=1 Tax=Brevipalpus obovatus TaxID=246614 RepID=UPI003D9EFE03